MPKNKKIAVGIDIGTTYSCVGVYQNGMVKVITDEQGNRVIPSCVAFTSTQRFIGDVAKAQAPANSKNTIFDFKRLLGKKHKDAMAENELQLRPFAVVNDQGQLKIEVTYKNEKRRFFPEEIISMILVKMKEVAENYLGQPVREAVVTVPSCFNDSQRQATKDAGAIAGIHILRIMNESTAAALAHGITTKEEEKNILVYDLGGGTFDVTVLVIGKGVFEVKATLGDPNLGGSNFDFRLVNYCANVFQKKHNLDITKSDVSMCRLHVACERAKRTLSLLTEANIEIDSLYEGIDFFATITRMRFEELNADYIRETLVLVEKVLGDANMPKTKIDDVILVGGSTKIPKIQKALQDFFNGKKLKDVNPVEAVACGAAIQAAILSGESSKEIKGIFVLDVAPFTVAIETNELAPLVIIPRNTTIPCSFKKSFSNYLSDDGSISIKVYEGENTITKDNHLLGKVELVLPKEIPEIEVVFEIDANGILNVTAEDKENGRRNNIEIHWDKGRLSKEDIKKMITDVEIFKDEDEKNKQMLQARKSFELYCCDLLKSAELLSEREASKIKKAASAGLRWLENHNGASKRAIEDRRASIERTCNPILENLRKGSGPRYSKNSSNAKLE